MTAKKKFIIAISSLASVAIAGVIALVVVIASFNANVTGGGFTINFTAYDIDATVTAGYYIGSRNTNDGLIQEVYNATYTTIQTTDNEDVMTFVGDNNSETKAFKTTNLNLGRDKALYIKYTVTNNRPSEDVAFSCVASFATTCQNASVYVEDDGAYESRPQGVWFAVSNGSNLVASFRGDQSFILRDYSDNGFAVGSSYTMYIKICPTDQTKDFNFDGSFNMTLIGSDE